MELGFKKTVTIKATGPITDDVMTNICTAIDRKYYIPYRYTKTPRGFILTPKHRFFSARGLGSNSFWPEIIAVHGDVPHTLQLTCRPPCFVRLFLTIWFGFVLLMTACWTLIYLTEAPQEIEPLIVLAAMLALGYLTARFGARFSADKILQILQTHI